MKKCEWKDGKFRTCDNFDGEIMTGFYSTDEENSMIIPFSQCKQCGADIRKPEPEVVIKKSGETWVMLFCDVDYLCPEVKKYQDVMNLDIKPHVLINKKIFKPISEIEITDDIAKLRPMVVHSMTENQLDTLYGVYKDRAIILDRNEEANCDYILVSFRLATVSDLENEEIL